MRHNPDKHHRRSIRLLNYDYSQSGASFITICTYQKQCILGTVVDDRVCLSDIGVLVEEEWLKSAQIRQEIDLDAWVVMPNHLHGIVIITQAEQPSHIQHRKFKRLQPRSLSALISGFKAAVTRRNDGGNAVSMITLFVMNNLSTPFVSTLNTTLLAGPMTRKIHATDCRGTRHVPAPAA